MNTHEILFYLFSIISIGCAFTVVTTSNPIHAILFLVGAFAGAGSLLMLFGAEYLAILFFILYIGAIAIVFLFVVMMLNIKQADLKETLRGTIARYLPLGAIIGFVSLFALIYIIIQDSVVLHSYSNIASLSELTQSVEGNLLENPYIE
jgi:NADH-quinone oxidoreductase subunit J